MFYSHEVLTDRKYGVATVWLVATLGAKSAARQVDRKEIAEVKIPKACKTITDPAVPLSLRLQSQLLYGVSRVYGQQCGYVLSDAEKAYATLNRVSNKLTAPIVERGHVARKDQITLQEDPNFYLDLAFDPDAGLGAMDLDLSFVTSDHDSGGLSPRSVRSSVLGSEHDDPSVAGLIIPPSASSHGDPFGIGIGGGSRHTSVSASRGMGLARYGSDIYRRDEEVEGLLDDPGFGFDADGNMVEGLAEERDAAMRSAHTPAAASRDGSVHPSTIRGTFDIPQSGNGAIQNEHDDFLPVQDDYDMYPDAEAFPIRDHAPRRPSDEVSSESSEASIVAPARRVRNRRALPLDETMELPNSDLVDWNNNYVRHMQEAVRIKHNNRSATVARVNANFWVLQSGVGGIGRLLGPERIPEPLQMFAGDKLLEALTGLRLGAAGEKHPREEEETGEGDGEERRVRSRTGESEVGRGDVDMPGLDDDELPQVYGDDTVEIGREGGTPLADRNSTLMPWNISASIRGSSVRPRTQPFSVGGTGFQNSSIGGAHARSLGHRVSSIAPSPLFGRGHPDPVSDDALGDYNDFGLAADDLESGAQAGHSTGLDHAAVAAEAPPGTVTQDEYEHFGATAMVDTQTAGTAAWMRDALDSESVNFLSFVEAAIQDIHDRDGGGQEEEQGALKDDSVDFEILLPHAGNSCVVAAQGLLHVLSLGTKSMLKVEQAVAFGAITLRLV